MMTRRRLGLALLATVTLLLTAGPVAARDPVDPNTLNPPPPDFFNSECTRTGSHITCTLAFSDPSIVDEPNGVICDGTELLFSQERSVVGKRTYASDGDLLRRHFHEDFTGTFTNPVTGRVVEWVAHNLIDHKLGAPGDLGTGFIKITGQQIRIFAPAAGTVLIDAGRVVIDESTGEIVSSSGPKHFDDYFINGNTAALQPLCDALG